VPAGGTPGRWSPGTQKTKEWAINPLLSWTDDDVWNYIRSREIDYCELYDERDDRGKPIWKRLGCVGCPMSSNRRKEFARWPRYEKLWRRSFRRLWEYRVAQKPNPIDGREWVGAAKFADADEMFEWWLSNDPLPSEECDGLPLF
jgi:phosphoadenosine phosphosulfate reductase